MTDFNHMINHETEIINKLHNDIHVTFQNRNKDVDSWKKACAKCHSYISAIDPIIDQMYEENDLSRTMH